jgi:TPP-dependent pyruvate/acetoin dehydrogenase alpha subunit
MMFLIRRVEEQLIAEYHPADEMRCPMHFCIGQEAMPAALSNVLHRNDVLMSHYRSHGYYLAKGASLDAMIAEFYGKITGANGGVAGSMELASHSYNYYSGAIVGGSLVIPLGSAFAQRYCGSQDISVSVFGDGALDEGIVYEVFNLAALHKLPLLMICENNYYAAHTFIERRMASPILADRARVFGLPVMKLDGNDSELLLSFLEPAVADIRSGRGPLFMEIETYRQCAHVGATSDDVLAYRSAEEIERWKTRDPVPRMRATLVDEIGSDELGKLEREVESSIVAALKSAKAAPFPDYAKTLSSNWSGEYGPGVKQFIHNPARIFDSGQAESRLAPY